MCCSCSMATIVYQLSLRQLPLLSPMDDDDGDDAGYDGDDSAGLDPDSSMMWMEAVVVDDTEAVVAIHLYSPNDEIHAVDSMCSCCRNRSNWNGFRAKLLVPWRPRVDSARQN